ncbi:MAG: 1,2-phenylacetyl-CoA epoxidase subunit PaaC [Flavobacteriales bacterium]
MNSENHQLLLRLGDDALILSQRLSEWCGHGPALEEDIALSNIALDLLGQARSFLTLAGAREGLNRTEDDLAYLRSDREFRNALLVELPNGHFGDTIMRQFLFDQFALLRYECLAAQRFDLDVAAISAKALKETKYHAEHSAKWVIRLGDGTDESHEKIQESLNTLWVYTGELFEPDTVTSYCTTNGLISDPDQLKSQWLESINLVLEEATLSLPSSEWMQCGGRNGIHTEHLSYLLAEMQVLQHKYPGAKW